MRIALVWSCLVLLFVGCGEQEAEGDLCDRYFEPYPDMITGRDAPKDHRIYVRAMELYQQGDHAQAADSLSQYIRQRGFERSAHLYLAMCHLAMDKPYEAELQLDHLENSSVSGFRDQTEWYTVLCWVCSGQLERALPEVRRIAGSTHTYKEQAARLADELATMVEA